MKRLAVVAAVVAGLALASVAFAAGTLRGTYKTKIHSTAFGGALNGTWTFKFTSGGYTITHKGKVTARGKDTIKGTKITLQPASGPHTCKAPGTYRFVLKGKTLNFTKVRDSNPACLGRQTILKGRFTKVG
jgi:hypothetical protein